VEVVVTLTLPQTKVETTTMVVEVLFLDYLLLLGTVLSITRKDLASLDLAEPSQPNLATVLPQ